MWKSVAPAFRLSPFAFRLKGRIPIGSSTTYTPYPSFSSQVLITIVVGNIARSLRAGIGSEQNDAYSLDFRRLIDSQRFVALEYSQRGNLFNPKAEFLA